MQNESSQLPPAAATGSNRRIKIFGVGTAGLAITTQMAPAGFAGASFVGVNTEPPVPSAAFAEHITLESRLLRGLGTGGDADRGYQLAEEHCARLKAACAGAEVVFIVAGLGGGTGTGVSSVLARSARESGALVLAFVTLPYDCEGQRRQQQAQQGLDQLKNIADGVVCLPNQKAVQLLAANVTLLEAFRATTEFLIAGAQGVWRLLTQRGLIEVHFSELCELLHQRHGETSFACAAASGAGRALAALDGLSKHLLLDGGAALRSADTVLISIAGGTDLTMADVNLVLHGVAEQCKNAHVIMGAAVDDTFCERIEVTLFVSRRRKAEPAKPVLDSAPEAAETPPEFDTELLHPTKAERPGARIIAPAPSLTSEQREQIITKQGGRAAKGRKVMPRMKQATLPLDIVNKGRFDKSEPTIHKGEDLDLPTYIRRGIALN